MLRAFVQNQADDGGQQGASTLTQQYVKNVLIQTPLRPRTPRPSSRGDRGGARGRRAPRATPASCARPSSPSRSRRRMTKDEILEKYLNIAPVRRLGLRRRVGRAVLLLQARQGPQLPRGRDDRRRHAEPDQVGPGAQPRGLAGAARPRAQRSCTSRASSPTRSTTPASPPRSPTRCSHRQLEAGLHGRRRRRARLRLLLRLRHQGHRATTRRSARPRTSASGCSTAAA